jgi:hypothetical protein
MIRVDRDVLSLFLFHFLVRFLFCVVIRQHQFVLHRVDIYIVLTVVEVARDVADVVEEEAAAGAPAEYELRLVVFLAGQRN